MHSTLPVYRNDALAAEDLSALLHVAERVRRELGLTPVMAAEIEFYLHGIERHTFRDAVLHDINAALADARIAALPVEKERGEEQYEIALPHTPDIARLARDISLLREIVEKASGPHDVAADFRASPLPDMPGSGLHIHLHLEDRGGHNLFYRDDDEGYSPPLRRTVGGMLALMRESMPLFAPAADSYRRFRPGMNAPVNVSWGPNNRTVAIRLPGKPLDNKHLEHRVSGADASPALAMLAVLAGAHYGIVLDLPAGDAIYGNAWEAHYGLPPLPMSLEEAVECMQHSRELPKYMGAGAMDNFLRRVLYPAAF